VFKWIHLNEMRRQFFFPEFLSKYILSGNLETRKVVSDARWLVHTKRGSPGEETTDCFLVYTNENPGLEGNCCLIWKNSPFVHRSYRNLYSVLLYINIYRAAKNVTQIQGYSRDGIVLIVCLPLLHSTEPRNILLLFRYCYQIIFNDLYRSRFISCAQTH
jgi:hypothetical protein